MSYTNKTEFYEIPLPIETDLYDPMDYNESMEAVDTALHGAVQNASTAVDTANSASDAAAAATSGLEELSGIVNTEKGKLTALTARVTAAENEIDDVRSDDQDAICAFNEPTATSTHAYAIGDYFFYNNVLYKATAVISIGDTIVPNTNCAATNVTTEIDAINTALSDKADSSTVIKFKTVVQLLGDIPASGDINISILPQMQAGQTIIGIIPVYVQPLTNWDSKMYITAIDYNLFTASAHVEGSQAQNYNWNYIVAYTE